MPCPSEWQRGPVICIARECISEQFSDTNCKKRRYEFVQKEIQMIIEIQILHHVQEFTPI